LEWCRCYYCWIGKKRINKTPAENCIDTRTIGGFCNWVEFDTRETYYYKNVINKKEEKEENGKQPENDNLPTNPVNNENVVNEPILIESDDYNEEKEKEKEDNPRASCSLLGRQSKRTNPFTIDDWTAEERHKKPKFDLFSMFKIHWPNKSQDKQN